MIDDLTSGRLLDTVVLLSRIISKETSSSERVRAVVSGEGAKIDVWYDYNPEEDQEGKKYPSSQPFHKLTNIVLSPHRGASPMNDLERWSEVVENIKLVVAKSDQVINLVDLELEY